MPQVGIINPSEFSPANSIEAVIWVAVGGRGTLVGAALGAVVVNFRQDLVHHRLSCAAIGSSCSADLFIFVTLAMPKGIVGTLQDWSARRRERATYTEKSAQKIAEQGE